MPLIFVPLFVELPQALRDVGPVGVLSVVLGDQLLAVDEKVGSDRDCPVSVRVTNADAAVLVVIPVSWKRHVSTRFGMGATHFPVQHARVHNVNTAVLSGTCTELTTRVALWLVPAEVGSR